MTDNTQPTDNALGRVKCSYCGQIVFDVIAPMDADGTPKISDTVRAQGDLLVRGHEATCPATTRN